MSDDALIAAAATVVGIAIRVGLATVVHVVVAIAEWSLAVGDAANSRATDGSSIRLIGADVLTSAAIVHARI